MVQPSQKSCCSSTENTTPKIPDNELNVSDDIKVKRAVSERYDNIAENSTSCGNCGGSSENEEESIQKYSEILGYSKKELVSIPHDANMGLGCGNPTALASISEGEIVVDLGSGGGIDCFLASKKAGPTGKVIGVDMTPSMIERARINKAKQADQFENVEFRLGEIEHLPIADNSADVIISNCVINLSTDKGQVFKEAFRVLKKGGRMMISDIVVSKKLPEIIQQSLEAHSGCVAGAMLQEEYFKKIMEAGFSSYEIITDHVAADFTKEMSAERKKQKKKPKIVLGGKEIEHNFTYEEVDDIGQSIRSIQFSAIK